MGTNIFSGENAAAIFNDPRPLLLFFRDPRRSVISDNYQNEITEQTRKIEDYLRTEIGDNPKWKAELCVVFIGAAEPMDMRFMNYVSVDYEDLPTIRIIQDPTATMVKFKLPLNSTTSSDNYSSEETRIMDNDLMYLNNALAINPGSVEKFITSVFDGTATPHLKSDPVPKPGSNLMDTQHVFTLVGE